MAVTLPKILVTFTQLATSFIQRSARGIAVLIVRDDTAGTGKTFFQYGDATQVSDTEFTPANQQYIKDALSFGPLRENEFAPAFAPSRTIWRPRRRFSPSMKRQAG